MVVYRRLCLILALSLPAVAQQPVQLQWSGVSSPSTVRIYRGAVCGGPFVVVAQNQPAAGPWNGIIPSTPGSSVAFQVTAVLNNLESAASNCIVLTVPALPAPPPAPMLTGTITPN